MSIIKFLIVFFTLSLFHAGDAQMQALYDDGDFSSGDFAPMSAPTIPFTFEQVSAILSLAPDDNRTLTVLDSATQPPCLSIMKGQNVGYRLATTQSSGFAFVPSNGMCPCQTCFRVMPCCGPIRNADGTTTPCLTRVSCQGNGSCLRNYECFGVPSTAPHASTGDDLKPYINAATAPVTTSCFKISAANSGLNGFTVKSITTGTGFQVEKCAVGTACLRFTPCCATRAKPCYTALSCSVPTNGLPGKNCLSVSRCDIPNTLSSAN